MERLAPREAVARIPDGARVILPHGAVEPTTFYEALIQDHQRFRDLHLYSGLQFGSYAYLDAGLGDHFTYTTWQASAKLRSLFREQRVEFLPLRFRDVLSVVRPGGPVPPDVVVVQIAPPENGRANLGISVSLYQELTRVAPMVIAEINPHMPRTRGTTEIPVERITFAIESDRPLGEYATPRRTERDERIADETLDLIPDGAWVQIGVGAIPDRVLGRLHEVRGAHLHSGMLTDGLIDFVERSRHDPQVVTGEVCGSAELYSWLARAPAVQLHPTPVTHGFESIARRPRFVSINSAVEIDLQGQINGETVAGVQMSGAGGSLDFVDGAAASEGGMAILALSSTTENGKFSKIVTRLAAEAPATIPRVSADVVVTEYGVARLRGKTLRQRAEALRSIAHPDFRDHL